MPVTVVICVNLQSQKALFAYFTSEQILPFAFPERCCCLFRVSGPALSLIPRSTCGWRVFVCRDHKNHTEQTVLHHLRSLVIKKQCVIPGKHDRMTLSRQIRHIYSMFDQWWASVVDGGPTLVKHWVDVSCLLTTHPPNVCPMLGQRRRRWANISQTVGKCVVFADDTSTLCSLVKHWVDVSCSCLLTTYLPNVWAMLGQRTTVGQHWSNIG